MVDASQSDYFARAQQLIAGGHERHAAYRTAWLEELFSKWPSTWGEFFCPLVFGDFAPPDEEIGSEVLGVWIEPTPLDSTVIASARTVLRARVRISARNLGGLKDAVARLQCFLGVLSWQHHGSPIHWWSYITAPAFNGGVHKLEGGRSAGIAEALAALPPVQSRRLRAALFWIKHSGAQIHDTFRDHSFGEFAGYWNALELLVTHACELAPPPRRSAQEDNEAVAAFLARINTPTAADIRTLHRTLSASGLADRARHALDLLVPEKAEEFWALCFDKALGEKALYRIRNGIAHGYLDVDDPEIARDIEARTGRLGLIVLMMLQASLAQSFTRHFHGGSPS